MNLCLLLLYALVSTASSQERGRVWHSTTPEPITSTSTPTLTSGVSTTGAAPVAAGPAEDTGPVVPEKVVASPESDSESPLATSQSGGTRDLQASQDVLTQDQKTSKKEEPLVAVEDKNEKKDRKWISAPAEVPKEKDVVINDQKTPEKTKKDDSLVAVEGKKEKKDRKWISAPKEEVQKEEEKVPKEETVEEERKEESLSAEDGKKQKKDRTWMSAVAEENLSNKETKNKAEPIEGSENTAGVSPEVPDKEAKPKDKKKKPRKWISVPGMEVEANTSPVDDSFAAEEESLDLAQKEVEDQRSSTSESPPEKDVDDYAINVMDLALPANISELLLAAEEGIPMVQETIISKKTTVYVTISESVETEPLFVNLTGIRHYTGQERRMVGGCLDLSDLMLTGEDAKEVIQRMAKHKFHKLDLSSNNITEFPANTFSPVAFTVRELRLDGNPLASNDQGEASVLQRGGLFHLTELRELNLSSCGLVDMDYFTPWNSNHLEVVDLSNNKLTTVPANLQFFHKLKKLFLDGNPITRVTELPFALLWNMQVLSLADCQVTTIRDDPFRNMDKLKEISLEGNNLTQIGNVRLPRSNSAVKMFLSGNPWHCACEMLNFIEHYHYAIRDIEYIRCASPRWLEGLRTAYLTKEILSLDSIDGDCTPASPRVSAHMPIPTYSPALRADRLQLLALIVFVLAAIFMLCHVLWARKKDKYRFEDDRDDIHYIRIEKKPNFK